MSGTAKHGKWQTLAATKFSHLSYPPSNINIVSRKTSNPWQATHWSHSWLVLEANLCCWSDHFEGAGTSHLWLGVCCRKPPTGSCNTLAVLHSHEDWTSWRQGGMAAVPIGIGPTCPQCAWEGLAKPTWLVNSLQPVSHTNTCKKIFLKPKSSGLHANCFLQLHQSGVDKSQLQWSLGHGIMTNIRQRACEDIPRPKRPQKGHFEKFRRPKNARGFCSTRPAANSHVDWCLVGSTYRALWNQHRRWSGCHHWRPG